MSGHNNGNKKGFSGLSDLTSTINDTYEPKTQEPNTETKQETTSSESDQKSTSFPQVVTVNSERNEDDSGHNYIVHSILFVVFIFLASLLFLQINYGSSNKKSSQSSSSLSQNRSYSAETTTTAVQTPSTTLNTELQYTKPPVGTNNNLSVPEIRWCVYEKIRIEAMRDIINTNAGIYEFNQFVNDYNSRCGRYRYRKGSKSQAERDVEAYRSRIVSEAISYARQLGHSYPPVLP